KAIIRAGFRRLPGFHLGRVFAAFGKVGELRLAELVWTSARRAKIRVQAFASPGRLDNQHRFVKSGVHGESERELRPDLPAVLGWILPGAVAGGEVAETLAVVRAAAGEVTDVGVLAHARLAIAAAHLFEQR